MDSFESSSTITLTMAMIHELRSTDIPDIVQFIQELAQVDSYIESIEEAAFMSVLDQACNRGGRDFRIVRQGHRIVGALLSGRFGVLDRPQDIRAFRILVRAGEVAVAERLLRLVEAQDGEESVTCRTVIGASRSMGKRILLDAGYEKVQEVSVLRRASLPLSPAVLPRGFKLRDAVPEQDSETVVRLYNIANRRSFGFAPLTASELRETLGMPGGRLLVVESEDGHVVGSVQTMPYFEGVGVIHAVQILPEYQGRGLGRFLIAVAMNVLAQHGFRTIELSVDGTNDAALMLYRSFSFSESSRDLVYEKNRP